MKRLSRSLYINILSLLLVWLAISCRAAGPLAGAGLDRGAQVTALAAGISLTSPVDGSHLPLPAVTVVGVAPTVQPLDTHTPAPTATATPTPDPYAQYTIEGLAERSYGGGQIQVEEILAVNSFFTRILFSYPSEGLRIYGFLNVPSRGTAPFPVVIASHGYIDPLVYDTIDYTTRYADALARNGFFVLHPNLRGYPPSDSGDDLFRVGMAVDVLNLIAIVKEHGGREGPLALADPRAIGVWGHSMGGGIATRVITVNPNVDAAVLYGAMGADEYLNFERIFTYFSNGTRGLDELAAPADAFERISPINYLDRIQAAVSIHHGAQDVDVPLKWSLELCEQLKSLGKTVECFTYKDQPHTFKEEGDWLFIQRTIDFYNRTLRSQPDG